MDFERGWILVVHQSKHYSVKKTRSKSFQFKSLTKFLNKFYEILYKNNGILKIIIYYFKCFYLYFGDNQNISEQIFTNSFRTQKLPSKLFFKRVEK